MVLEDLASLVKDLHSQVWCLCLSTVLIFAGFGQAFSYLTMRCALQLDNMTSCKVGVTVLVAQGSRHTELANSAKQVARFAQLLHLQQQLALRVSFEAATDTTILPPPGVLQQLQACLYQFDTYSIPTEQPAASRTLSAETNSKITYDHLWYLSNTNRKSICTFSISTDHDFEVSSSVKAGIIGALAPMMSTLTKLHLTIRDSFFLSTIDFQPLAQLGLLTDLALQIVHKVPTCCDGVLRSNRQTLQSVTLTAGSWTAATYGSLQHIAQLKVLTITIMEVDAAQAQALGGVKAELFRLTLHGAVSPEGI